MSALKPHITGESIPDGRYIIQNVRWKTFLELPNPKDTSIVVSASEKQWSRQWWRVVDLGFGKYSIKNIGRANDVHWGFGSQKSSAVVDRSPKQKDSVGAYSIQPMEMELYWGLPNGSVGTQVQLQANPFKEGNQWHFIPLD